MEELGLASVGAGWISKAHGLALRSLESHFPEFPVRVRRKVLVEQTPELARRRARDLGFESWTTSWKDAIADPEVQIVDIITPNYLHQPIAVYAAQQKKHILCEKPLATTCADAEHMYRAAETAGVVHMVGFSYRYAPALQQIEKWVHAGIIGQVRHFHGVYCQQWGIDDSTPLDWHFQSRTAGSGSLGDLGAHLIDAARAFVGEIDRVAAVTRTFVTERPLTAGSAFLTAVGEPGDHSRGGAASKKKGRVDVDDSAFFVAQFDSGAVGNFAVSRAWPGYDNHFAFEVGGSRGSIAFDWDRPNEVQIAAYDQPRDRAGFTRVPIGNAAHPYTPELWPMPLGIGFTENFIIEMYEFLRAVSQGGTVRTTFEDGWKACRIIDAVLRSSRNDQWVKVDELSQNQSTVVGGRE